MKRDITEFVFRCLTCQQVKLEHQKLSALLQPLLILEWKWKRVTMDFVTGLPRTSAGYNSIWVIMDQLTKFTHFLPVKTTYSMARYARLYIKRIMCLYGVPISIVSDKGPQFTSRFWKKLQEGLGNRLHFSMAFHPQIDGQSK